MTIPDGRLRNGDTGHAVDVTVERSAGAMVLGVSGEIDQLTAPLMKEAVLRALAECPPLLVIDLRQVTFFASAGLAILVEADQRAADDMRIRVVAAGSATLLPLRATGLDQPFEVYTTRGDALRAG